MTYSEAVKLVNTCLDTLKKEKDKYLILNEDLSEKLSDDFHFVVTYLPLPQYAAISKDIIVSFYIREYLGSYKENLIMLGERIINHLWNEIKRYEKELMSSPDLSNIAVAKVNRSQVRQPIYISQSAYDKLSAVGALDADKIYITYQD